MGVASLIVTGVATGLQVYSQMQAGKTAERVAKVNDKNAQTEAKNLEAEARNKQLEFAEGVKRERINQRKAMASLRARLSGSGTLMNSGTAMDILGETAGNFQLAISDAARASTMQVTSIYQRADGVRRQGKMGIWEAGQAKQASTLEAFSTGLSGVSKSVSAYGHNKYTGFIP
jgi:hypothetical protein